ncbi:MAG: amidohydrolase family protein [Streptosporangiales bacterium]|nr:amidohydrolase family protein [Streptosporangiales bacterium]
MKGEAQRVFDLVVRGGTVYGAGDAPSPADVAVVGDRIAAVGRLDGAEAITEIDAAGKAVAPGFINILSHSYFTILHDPRSLGELTQGVTTQVFGEGSTMGPLTPAMKEELERRHADLSLRVSWSRLSEYLAHVEGRGCSQNIASFVGTGTLRPYAVGYDDRPATKQEIDTMRGLVAEEMADGALGIASALIYPPESYISTEELVAVCEVAASYGGIYISHMRDEGAGLLTALDELLRISREAKLPAEIFHLKASGRRNWQLMDEALERVESARAGGAPITADVYPYTASSTGLASVIPPRYHEGGPAALYDRLADPETRRSIRQDLLTVGRWGDTDRAEDVLILRLEREENRRYQGMTLSAIAEARGTDPIEATLDLIRDDRSRVGAAFFSMSEDNLRTQLRRLWVGIGSDGSSMAPEGVFLRSPTHPRAYGTFARVLGRYVREERVLDLSDAIDRMTRLPATTLGLEGRGRLAEGCFADIVVFVPETVADRATFDDPHRLSVGVSDVVVNGEVAVRAGEPTGRLAGRALYGPGRRRH